MTTKQNKPEKGKVYRLTGTADVASIGRGDSWEASEVPDEKDKIHTVGCNKTLGVSDACSCGGVAATFYDVKELIGLGSIRFTHRGEENSYFELADGSVGFIKAD